MNKWISSSVVPLRPTLITAVSNGQGPFNDISQLMIINWKKTTRKVLFPVTNLDQNHQNN